MDAASHQLAVFSDGGNFPAVGDLPWAPSSGNQQSPRCSSSLKNHH